MVYYMNNDSIKSYKMFCRDKYIADFIEDWSDRIKGVQLKIVIRSGVDLTSSWDYASLRYLHKDGVIDDKMVRHWIDNRVTPRTQGGIERKLREAWGMSEYDELTIMHQSLAINVQDFLWVQFNPKATYQKNHPRGKDFIEILPMIPVKRDVDYYD